MKILKHSQEKKELREFTCKKCGCVFECEDDEYFVKQGATYGINSITCSAGRTLMTCCPECHKVVEKYDYNGVISYTLDSNITNK